MPYCEKCGNQISEEAVFCTACGNRRNVGGAQTSQHANVSQPQQNYANNGYPPQQPQQPYGYNGYQPQQGYGNNGYQYQPPQSNYGYAPYPNQQQMINPLLYGLIKKIKTEAFVWIGIASMQAIAGLIYLIYDYDAISMRDASQWFTGFALLIVAALNFFVCKKDFDYAKEIAKSPVDIVDKYRPVGGYVSNLIYNLIFGGVIGVVGSIFGFITRSYVLNNEQGFKELEKQHIGTGPVKFGNQWECPNCRKVNSYNIKNCVCGQQRPE